MSVAIGLNRATDGGRIGMCVTCEFMLLRNSMGTMHVPGCLTLKCVCAFGGWYGLGATEQPNGVHCRVCHFGYTAQSSR